MIWELTLRLLLAGILGAVIGLDREYRAKEAGFRTHFLVSLGKMCIRDSIWIASLFSRKTQTQHHLYQQINNKSQLFHPVTLSSY